MDIVKKYAWLGFVIFSWKALQAQPSHSFTLRFNTDYILPANLQNEYAFSDTIQLYGFLSDKLDSLRQTGYLSASIDSLTKYESIYNAHLYLGQRYDQYIITNGNVEPSILKKSGIDRFLQQPIAPSQLQFLKEALVAFAENTGFPFASVRLDSLLINKNIIEGKLYWEKGRQFRFDDIQIEGEAQLKTSYLENYLGLKKGSIYQKEKLSTISQKLKELPFVIETRPSIVRFKGEEARVNLFLDTKKANRFDFLIGVLPNNAETGRVLITADIEAEFQNQFGRGERIFFQFEQLRPETQQLRLQTNLPYVLQTPLGVDFDFGLYRRDTTYRDLIWNIGFQYLWEGGNYIRAFSRNTVSTLLTIDERSIIRNRQLPQNLDLRNNSFGLTYFLEKLDYRFNPRRGWLLHTEASAGFKEIRRNSRILDLQDMEDASFNFSSLYDALDLNTFQYQLSFKLDKYFPIQKRSVLKTSLTGASIIAENPIYRNEQFRIGGNQLLRGFDEESIFATTYALGILEYRYLISQNSYFFLFGDFAYVENKTTENDFTNRPIGIGAGMTFETKAGLFGISYALGKLENEPFEFRRAKVHFGFVSLF